LWGAVRHRRQRGEGVVAAAASGLVWSVHAGSGADADDGTASYSWSAAKPTRPEQSRGSGMREE
jgi:hypothetical protein